VVVQALDPRLKDLAELVKGQWSTGREIAGAYLTAADNMMLGLEVV